MTVAIPIRRDGHGGRTALPAGCGVEAVIASQDQIDQILDTHYRTVASVMEGLMMQLGEEAGVAEKVESIIDTQITDDDVPIIKLVTGLIIEAYRIGASDIHMEPMEKTYRVRYRIDGILHEVDAPPKYLQANVTSRLKIMAHLDITEKRIPQDGRIQINVGDKDLDLRVSSVPTTHGESIVMRLLDKSVSAGSSLARFTRRHAGGQYDSGHADGIFL